MISKIDIKEQDIKMKVSDEQCKEVQTICYDLGIYWRASVGGNFIEKINYLVLTKGYLQYALEEEDFIKLHNKEVSAEEFINTKGFTKEIKDVTTLAEPNTNTPKPKAIYRIKHQYDNTWLYYWDIANEYYWSEDVQDADLMDSFDKALEVIEGHGLEGMIETIYCSSKA